MPKKKPVKSPAANRKPKRPHALKQRAVKRTAGEIQTLNRELERKVAARTADLLESNRQLKEEAAERGRVEAELLESKERFTAFMNHTVGAAWMKDDQGRYVYINKFFERRFNMVQTDVRGKTDFEIFSDDIARQLHEHDLAVLSSDQALEMEESVPTPDGSMHHWMVFKFPFRDPIGRRFVGGMAFDITEKRLLEQHVRQSEKLAAVGQLTAGLAHEIGTPLNVIAGRAELMLRRMAPDDPNGGHLERILSQIERITKIVKQLLGVARSRPLETRPVSPGKLIQEVLALFDHQLKARHISVDLDASGPRLDIAADTDQIQQVLFNVLSNAIQAMPSGGTLTVRINRTIPRRDREDAVKNLFIKVEIYDTGVGIPADKLTRVFDPFFTTKESGEGTGLGLAISSRIVQSHGGWMTVKSTFGEGSRFGIFLPIEPAVLQPARDRG